jgi:hypothetical protein
MREAPLQLCLRLTSWRDLALFRPKVEGLVPHTQNANLSTASQPDGGTARKQSVLFFLLEAGRGLLPTPYALNPGSLPLTPEP